MAEIMLLELLGTIPVRVLADAAANGAVCPTPHCSTLPGMPLTGNSSGALEQEKFNKF